jgi:hypothetical protein
MKRHTEIGIGSWIPHSPGVTTLGGAGL